MQLSSQYLHQRLTMKNYKYIGFLILLSLAPDVALARYSLKQVPSWRLFEGIVLFSIFCSYLIFRISLIAKSKKADFLLNKISEH